MKALITTIALASALAAGTASATNFEVGQIGGVDVQDNAHYHSTGTVTAEAPNLPGTNFEVGQIGGRVDVQDNTHYHSTGTAMTDSANLPGSSYSSALFVGNK
ncbi:hypothetical protein Q4508_17110 [Amphritea sp. 2_MG-2023]|uniref:hypothetical protein n=1 Tax=Amphritea TaxID=515417 RepID=UPI001C073FF6|nr:MULTISPECIES: hypothetical protein [Amphritea]MBU2964019.1 hypothetical protein [Amphritea atlantica]MDO6420278.1 hypothetical protein [Amphritea sp. 2_MG-2023]